MTVFGFILKWTYCTNEDGAYTISKVCAILESCVDVMLNRIKQKAIGRLFYFHIGRV